jgi:hypothetical protein
VFCHRLEQSSDFTYTSLIPHSSWNNPTPYLLKATFILHTTPLSYYADHFLKTSLNLTMPGPWDQDTDRKLLLCLVDPNLKAKWAEVATSMGPSFTSESVRYVFWKIGAWSVCCHTQCSRISLDSISTLTGRSSPSKFLISHITLHIVFLPQALKPYSKIHLFPPFSQSKSRCLWSGRRRMSVPFSSSPSARPASNLAQRFGMP